MLENGTRLMVKSWREVPLKEAFISRGVIKRPWKTNPRFIIKQHFCYEKVIILLLLLPLQILANNPRIYYHEEYRPLKDNPRIVQYYQGLIKDPQPVESSYYDSERYDYVCYQIYLDEDRAELWASSEHFHGLSPENSSFTVPETVPYEGKDYPVTCIGGMSNSLIGELIRVC